MDQHAPSTIQGEVGGPTRRAPTALAVAALVVSILGWCLPLLGPMIALVLGVVALVKTREAVAAGLAKGLSIAAIALSSVALLMIPIQIGILLPALNSARLSAQRVETMSNARSLGAELLAYEVANDAFPNESTWRRDLLAAGAAPEWFDASYAVPNVPSFYFVPESTTDADTGQPTDILLYEHPSLFDRGGTVVYRDGSVEWLEQPDLRDTLSRLRTPFGGPFAPHERYVLPR